MKGSGGTEGGFFLFGIGFLLSAVAAWFLLDSVIATSGHGFFSGFIRGRNGIGSGRSFGQTTSMGIIFVPFMIGVMALFYDSSKKWAWGLMYLGIGVVAVEILSHLRFEMSVKTSHLMLMLGMFAAGVGMMLRSYRDTGQTIESVTRQAMEDGASTPPGGTDAGRSTGELHNKQDKS